MKSYFSRKYFDPYKYLIANLDFTYDPHLIVNEEHIVRFNFVKDVIEKRIVTLKFEF